MTRVQKPILDEYLAGALDLSDLKRAYKAVGTEGHDISPYRDVLEFARNHPDRCRLHGGFIPRTYARKAMRDGLETTLVEVPPSFPHPPRAPIPDPKAWLPLGCFLLFTYTRKHQPSAVLVPTRPPD